MSMGTLYFVTMEEYMDAILHCHYKKLYFEGTEFKDSDNTFNYALQILGVSDGKG